MPARIASAALRGIDAVPIIVEVDVLAGLPSFSVVGLGDTAIKESKERLTSALNNLGYDPPRRKTIVSLAPASLKKEGSRYDVPIALGYLIASRQIEIKNTISDQIWFIGELGLDGTIRPVTGVLPTVLAAAKSGIKELYIPQGNAAEAAAITDKLTIYPVHSLAQLIGHLTSENTETVLKKAATTIAPQPTPTPDVDFADIKGQDHAKRALLIAAAASHNVLLVGPPGTGKTLLAKALAGIVPPLTTDESHTVTSLYSIAGQLPAGSGLITQRPYRAPHHGASSVALIGGGTHPKPGEVSLAHTGVLFLDELPEFARHVLNQLRQPLEDGIVTVSRAADTVQFPARCQLVGAMNPCPCGYIGSERKDCNCTPGDIVRYQRRLSGPLLDRFDLHVLVADIPIKELLSGEATGPTSAELAEQAHQARQRAHARQDKPNSALTSREIKQHCAIDQASHQLLYQAEERFHLSSRAVHRLLKVARTIADLEDSDTIQSTHLAEALQYREQLTQAIPDLV